MADPTDIQHHFYPIMETQPIPSHYLPGAILPIHIEGSGYVNFTIAHAFPPTNSQVVVARQAPHTPKVILKIYDHAALQHRHTFRRPLDLAAEVASSKNRKDPHIIRRDRTEPDYDADAIVWEEFYFRTMQNMAWSETEAYKCLVPLQGKTIPAYYGSAMLQLNSISSRSAVVQVAIMEYVHDLSDLVETPKAKITDAFQQSLKETVVIFGKLGVIHGDLVSNNILFTPKDKPTRALIIDFGECYFKEQESEAEWAEIVQRNNEEEMLVGIIHWRMNHKRYP